MVFTAVGGLIRLDMFDHRRDQRAFLLPSPAAGRPCAPHDRAGSVRNKARSSRAVFLMPNNRRAFRLRFGDGRYTPAPFPPSLRLRFTFPFAEPQAEATSRRNNVIAHKIFKPVGVN